MKLQITIFNFSHIINMKLNLPVLLCVIRVKEKTLVDNISSIYYIEANILATNCALLSSIIVPGNIASVPGCISACVRTVLTETTFDTITVVSS
jgi:hypothetical protein